MPVETKDLPYGFTLFCDDVRQEVSGKMTYVGVYGDQLVTSDDFPITLPALHFMVHLFGEAGKAFDVLDLFVFLPGDKDDAPTVRQRVNGADLAGPPTNSDTSKLRAHIAMQVALSPLRINDEGTIRVNAMWDGNPLSLGSLKVIKAAE